MSVPTCVITGEIKGHPQACGDCDPCILGVVPEPVKRLLDQCNAWASLYEAEAGSNDDLTRQRDEARAEAERLRAALRWSVGAAINSLLVDGREPEWSEGSGIGVGLRALGCHSLTLDAAARAALTPTD